MENAIKLFFLQNFHWQLNIEKKREKKENFIKSILF